MIQRTSNDKIKTQGERVALRASAAEQIRYSLLNQIGDRSFQIDFAADTMADMGAAAIAPYLDTQDRFAFRRIGNGHGEPFLVIDGLPVQDNIPPTPQAFHDDATVAFTDALLLGCIRLARLEPIAVEYENFGRLIRNVCPVKSAAESVSSHGSKLPLEWHTDNAYEFEGRSRSASPSPHFLCFAGIRNKDATGLPVATELLPVTSIIAAASNRLLNAMQKRIFEVKPGQSNDRSSLGRMPLLEYCELSGEPWLRFNANEGQTVGTTDNSKRTIIELAELVESLDDEIVSINVEPGSVLVFDNYRVLHRRKSFDAGDLRSARWLRRCFAARDRDHGVYVDALNRPFVWS